MLLICQRVVLALFIIYRKADHGSTSLNLSARLIYPGIKLMLTILIKCINTLIDLTRKFFLKNCFNFLWMSISSLSNTCYLGSFYNLSLSSKDKNLSSLTSASNRLSLIKISWIFNSFWKASWHLLMTLVFLDEQQL